MFLLQESLLSFGPFYSDFLAYKRLFYYLYENEKKQMLSSNVERLSSHY